MAADQPRAARGAAVVASLRRDLTVLSNKPFRALFWSRTISMAGSSVAPIALAFAVLDRKGASAGDLGVVLAARSITQVIFLLYGGVLSDRMSRYRQMVISDLLAFAAQSAIALLFAVRIPSLAPIVALAAVNGAASALFSPPARAITPDVVAPGQLQQATALLRLARSISSVGGTAIAGILVAVVGSSAVLGIDAASFLCSALLLAGLRGMKERPRGSVSGGLIRELREGWNEFRSRAWVWVVVAQFSVVNLCFTPGVMVLGVVIVRQRLGGAPSWSLVLAMNAIGLVLGGLVAIRLRTRRPVRTAVFMTVGFLPPFAALAFGAPLWAVALAMLVNGFCADGFEVLWETSLQLHVPARALARVSSYDALGSFVLGPLGLMLVGPVSAFFGIQHTLVGAGLLMLLATVLALAVPAVRHLPARPVLDVPAADDLATHHPEEQPS